jgi:hypothetical protein
MVKMIKKTLITILVALGTLQSKADANLLCLDLLNPSANQQVLVQGQNRDLVEFTQHNLQGFEMTASMVVWYLIKNKKITGISLTDAINDQDSIWEDIKQNPQLITRINTEIQKAFDAIFNNADDRGQVGYLMMAERDPNGFTFATLSELYRRDENFVHRFLKDNLEAVVYNARRMSPLYAGFFEYWSVGGHLRNRLFSPSPYSDRAQSVWMRSIGGVSLLAALMPHANLSYIGNCLSGDCHEILYVFADSARYIDDSFMFMVSQSIMPAALAAAGGGAVYWISRRVRSWLGTQNSPRFDLAIFNPDIGAEVRYNFAREAGQADQSGGVQTEMDFVD